MAGEAADNEALLLNSLLKNDFNIKTLFIEYQKTWNLIKRNHINIAIDIEEELTIIKTKIKKVEKKTNAFPLISEKRSKKFFGLQFLRIAAVFLLIVISSIVFYRYLNNDQSKIIFAKLSTVENNLPDGTSVTLNIGSTLVYPEKFKSKTREVKLKGEAYFKVSHDVTKPFVISTEDVRIEVLGTSFYVNTSSSNGNIEVILNMGKVAIYYKDKPLEKIILQSGEKAEVSKTENNISKSVNDEINYMAWKTKKIVFVNDSLGDIVKTLNKVYHSNINITNEKLLNCRITASFDNQSLESILEVLKATINISMKKTGSIIEISGNGCKN